MLRTCEEVFKKWFYCFLSEQMIKYPISLHVYAAILWNCTIHLILKPVIHTCALLCETILPPLTGLLCLVCKIAPPSTRLSVSLLRLAFVPSIDNICRFYFLCPIVHMENLRDICMFILYFLLYFVPIVTLLINSFFDAIRINLKILSHSFYFELRRRYISKALCRSKVHNTQMLFLHRT